MNQLPGYARSTTPNVDIEAGSSACEALFGAFMCEDGWTFASLTGLWRWLLKDPKAADSTDKDELGMASVYLRQRPLKLRGRTPTFSTLQEVQLPDATKALQVHYVDAKKTLLYRLHGARAQEKEKDEHNPEAHWEWIRFDAAQQTLVSSVLRNNLSNLPVPLPYKVCSYLARNPLASLTKVGKKVWNARV